MSTATEVVSSIVKTSALFNVIVNVLLGASLSYLWGLVNTLQMVNNLTLFSVYLPANVQEYNDFI